MKNDIMKNTVMTNYWNDKGHYEEYHNDDRPLCRTDIMTNGHSDECFGSRLD